VRADAQHNRAAILAAAEAVFAERGPQASTQEVATRAGVAVGTVFRHFPTKTDLLRAIMKELLQRLSAQVRSLADNGDPATALFDFFTGMVEEAASQRTVVELLAATGLDVPIAAPIASFQTELQQLLARAQQAGAVRADVQIQEVSALLISTCQGAIQSSWPPPLRQRIVNVIIAGLRSSAS
jgi:AcrR family transcriptional regulator